MFSFIVSISKFNLVTLGDDIATNERFRLISEIYTRQGQVQSELFLLKFVMERVFVVRLPENKFRFIKIYLKKFGFINGFIIPTDGGGGTQLVFG